MSGSYLDDNGVYYEGDPMSPTHQPVAKRTTEQRISFLFGELSRVKNEKFGEGYPCTLDAGATCIQCRFGSDDKANLTDIFVRAKQFVDAGDPTHQCKVRCAMNMDHFLAASDMVTFLTGMFDWGQGIMDKYHTHKDEVLALQTIVNDPNSTQVQLDAAVAALNAYDVTIGW